MDSHNVSIKSSTIANSGEEGITIESSHNVSIVSSLIANNEEEGIYILNSHNINIIYTNFVNCGLNLWNSYNNSVVNSFVNGLPLLYLENKSDIVVNYPVGEAILVNSHNITLKGIIISNNNVIGANIISSSNVSIVNMTITNNKKGVLIRISSNVSVVNNTITNNSRGWGIFVCNSQNASVVNSEIANNGQRGIWIWSSSNVSVMNSRITNNDKGIEIRDSQNVSVSFNVITGNNVGIYNRGYIVNASYNWWGDISGPSGIGFGSGDSIIGGNVTFGPWLSSAPPSGEPVDGYGARYNIASGGGIADASDIAGVVVEVNSSKSVMVGVVNYTMFPKSLVVDRRFANYFDVYINSTDGVNEVLIKIYYNEAYLRSLGVSERLLSVYWLNGSKWELCSLQGVNVSEKYIWVKITNDTMPSLSDLAGLPFVLVSPPTVNGVIIDLHDNHILGSHSGIELLIVSLSIAVLIGGLLVLLFVRKNSY